MPKKYNSAGQLQNYVPAGNGDASGEYGDNATGSNKHFKAFFKEQVSGQIDGQENLVMDEKQKHYNHLNNLIENYGDNEEGLSAISTELNDALDKDKITTEQYTELKDKLENKIPWWEKDDVEDLDIDEELDAEDLEDESIDENLEDLKQNVYDELNKKIDDFNAIKDDEAINNLLGDMDGAKIDGYITEEQYEELKTKLNDKLNEEKKQSKEVEKETIAPMKKTWAKQVDKLTDEDCYDVLLNTYEGEFDVDKLKNATTEELHNLVMAKKNAESKETDTFKKFKKDLKDANEEYYIWNKLPDSADKLEESINKKKEYYEKQLEHYKQQDTDWAKDKVEFYTNATNKLDEIQGGLLQDWKKADAENEEKKKLVEQSKAYIDKFVNPDNVYSQSAKDKAHWFKSYDQSTKFFGDMKETYDKIGKEDLQHIINYTSSYSFINEPLRNTTYYGSKSKKGEFVKAVTGMTNAINKSELKENMWVQRGVSKLNINGKTLDSYADSEDLQNLVGKTFEDQGFFSASAHKGAKFGSYKSIMLNVYAPKGTKALYVNPISYFKGDSEDEIILQRGYSYKITKAYKEKGTTYFDVEVVLGSDSKKYDTNKLKELAEKHF